MQGVGIDRFNWAEFDHLAQIHYPYFGAHVTDCRQVMGYHNISQLELLLQIFQQVHDLGANGNIQGGDRLIQNDNPRIEGQRSGYGDPLSLSSAELVGKQISAPIGQSNQTQQFTQAVSQLVPAELGPDRQRLGDNLINSHPRIQRRERILENHLHFPPIVGQILPIQLVNVLLPE